MSSYQTFTFGEDLYEHRIGDPGCHEGWCQGGRDLSSGQFPHVHEGCGGLVHADFGDENADCDYWLWKCCDRCGETSFYD